MRLWLRRLAVRNLSCPLRAHGEAVLVAQVDAYSMSLQRRVTSCGYVRHQPLARAPSTCPDCSRPSSTACRWRASPSMHSAPTASASSGIASSGANHVVELAVTRDHFLRVPSGPSNCGSRGRLRPRQVRGEHIAVCARQQLPSSPQRAQRLCSSSATIQRSGHSRRTARAPHPRAPVRTPCAHCVQVRRVKKLPLQMPATPALRARVRRIHMLQLVRAAFDRGSRAARTSAAATTPVTRRPPSSASTHQRDAMPLAVAFEGLATSFHMVLRLAAIGSVATVFRSAPSAGFPRTDPDS